jgi:hypothetical protein
MIRVSDGVLSVQNVIAELQRLIPGGWVWNVEEVGNNSFRTVFPSRAELLRMVEWGVLHSKFQNAKLKIEERMVDSEVRYVLPKLWVQFTALSPHLQDFSIIWAIGAILGVTKDVDMVFTRRLDICRLQVLLMNLNLVPQTINVVIGENLYELKFHVELDPSGSNPQPMETDNEQGSGRGNPRMEAGDKGTGTGQHMGQNSRAQVQHGRGSGQSGSVSKEVPKDLLPTFHIQVPLEEGAELVVDSGARQSAPGACHDANMQTNHCGLAVNDGSSMYGVQEDNGQTGQDGAQMDLALVRWSIVVKGRNLPRLVCRRWRIVMKGILLMVL